MFAFVGIGALACALTLATARLVIGTAWQLVVVPIRRNLD